MMQRIEVAVVTTAATFTTFVTIPVQLSLDGVGFEVSAVRVFRTASVLKVFDRALSDEGLWDLYNTCAVGDRYDASLVGTVDQGKISIDAECLRGQIVLGSGGEKRWLLRFDPEGTVDSLNVVSFTSGDCSRTSSQTSSPTRADGEPAPGYESKEDVAKSQALKPLVSRRWSGTPFGNSLVAVIGVFSPLKRREDA